MISRRKFSAAALVSTAQLVAPTWLLAAGNDNTLPHLDDPSDLAVRDTPLLKEVSRYGNLPEVFPGVPIEQTYDRAQQLLGSHFEILLGETEIIRAELVDVTNVEYRFHTDAFYLVFNTSWSPVLDEGLYTFVRPEMGTFKLFLQPSTEQPYSGHSYTVLVNRIVQEPI